jgi:ankyrin repeat protein
VIRQTLLRFSLRQLLVAVCVCALFAALAARYVKQRRDDVFLAAVVSREASITSQENLRLERILVARRNLRTIKGLTAWVAKHSDARTLDVVLKKGGDPNERQGFHRATPLFWTVLRNDEQATALLLSFGADANQSNHLPGFPSDLLGLACGNGSVKIATLLIDNGAPVNLADKEESSPLHCAVGSGNIELVVMLANRGADINAKNRLGFTPDQWAALHSRIAAVNGDQEKVSAMATIQSEFQSQLAAK